MIIDLINALLRVGSNYIGSPEGDPLTICMILFVMFFSILFIGTTVINLFRNKR